MSTDRFTMIGLDRIVRVAWLEKVASLVLAGNEAKDIRAILQNDLCGAFRSHRTDVRGSLDKTITILMKVWLTTPAGLDALRVGGLDLIQRVPSRNHLAVHWGMVMSVYPFWSGVATQVGRLLRLQGSAAAAQVQRRMREQYGDRETVSRRTRYVLRSYLDWGVLQEGREKGIYCASPSVAIEDTRLIAWLIEASLHARPNGSAPLKDATESPSLFPFSLGAIRIEDLVAASTHLDSLRHSLSDELLMLRK